MGTRVSARADDGTPVVACVCTLAHTDDVDYYSPLTQEKRTDKTAWLTDADLGIDTAWDAHESCKCGGTRWVCRTCHGTGWVRTVKGVARRCRHCCTRDAAGGVTRRTLRVTVRMYAPAELAEA